jgi:hypothetical protein
MKLGKLFGRTGGPLWAFAGIEVCTNLRHSAQLALHLAATAEPAGDRQ